MKSLYSIVGTRYRGEAIVFLLKSLPAGETLTLVREIGNPHDEFAVQVHARGEHIGYISSKTNKKIAKWLDVLDSAKGQSAEPVFGNLVWLAGWPCVETEI